MNKAKHFLGIFLSVALIAAAVFFLGRELAENWEKIRDYEFRFSTPLLILSFAAYGLCFLILTAGWHFILRTLGHGIRFRDAFIYFIVTQPAKYIPGKIWLPVARMKCLKRHGISNSVTLLSTLLEATFEVLAGMYVSLIALSRTEFLKKWSVPVVAAITIFGVLLLIPHFFYFCVNTFLRLTRKPIIEKAQRVSFGKLLALQLVFIAGIVTLGVSNLIFLQSFAPIDSSSYAFAVSVFIFSYVASILAFFAPAGIGVREGVLFLALKNLATAPVALIFSVASRLWNVAAEALFVFIVLPALLLKRTSRSGAVGDQNKSQSMQGQMPDRLKRPE